MPAWAIQKACRWWMSADNEDRRKKPIAGDIAARAKIEMGAVKLATSALGRFERGGVLPEASERNVERCSGEAASEIMAQAGFSPKRFGGDA